MGLLQKLDAANADVFITEELSRRAPKKVDYLREKQALQALAACMTDQPQDVLVKFVDLAMEMTGGVSAGLSLFEENPAPGVFRWQYLRGLLAPFNGATTPRNFSPCGITLDQNGPVLSVHPERVYTWISDANIVVPEVLLVPLYIGGDVPLGTLWIVSDKEGHFDSGHARVITELASFVGIALSVLRKEERLQAALAEQETLAKEMNHRVKNLFAVTESMIRLSARGTSTKDELVQVLSGRMRALASAHALVRRNFSDMSSEARTSDLEGLIKVIVRPHENAGNVTPRIRIKGESIQCGDHAINGLALVLHELATNASKYGALKCDDGIVDISWRREADKLVLRWTERAGPEILHSPPSTGFGSALAQATITRQFDGTLDCHWHADGLVVTITLPMKNLAS